MYEDVAFLCYLNYALVIASGFFSTLLSVYSERYATAVCCCVVFSLLLLYSYLVGAQISLFLSLDDVCACVSFVYLCVKKCEARQLDRTKAPLYSTIDRDHHKLNEMKKNNLHQPT